MEMSIPWPGRKDKIFSGGIPFNPSYVSLDSWMEFYGWDALLPDAYKESADIIVSYIEEGKVTANPDPYFFPIVYLYRHSFELQLKKLIYMGIELEILEETGELKGVLCGHGLYPLWNKAKEVILDVWPDGDKDDIKNVERLIQEIHIIDKTGQTFRYSKDISGKSTTKQLPRNVDLTAMKRA